ncbi:MAG: hypothetical protein WBH50_13280 [Fuerstiella sp.]
MREGGMGNWYAEEFDDPSKQKTAAKKQHANPFAAGDAWQENGQSDSYDDVESDYTRDGKELVVTSGATLPAICIKSGSTSQLNPVTVTLSHSPPWAFLVGGVLLAMLFQKKCEVTYFVSQEVSARIKKRKLFGGLGIVAGIIVLVGGLVVWWLSSLPL